MLTISERIFAVFSIIVSLIVVGTVSYFSLRLPSYILLTVSFLPVFSILRVLRSPRKYKGTFNGKVSVIIAAKNEEEVIERTISEAEKLKYKDFEIIVVDDGSTDSTGKRLEYLKLKYENLRVLHVPVKAKTHGKAAALNRAFSIVKGDIILIIDADVILKKDFLQEATRPFDDSSVGAVQTGIRAFNAGNVVSFIGDADSTFTNILMEYFLNPRSFGSGFLMRRSVVEKVYPLEENTISEDTQISLMIRSLGMKIVYYPTVTIFQSVPMKLTTLFKQRKRWFFGALVEMLKNDKKLFFSSVLGTFFVDAAFALLVFNPFSFLAMLLLALLISSLLVTLINFKRFNLKNPLLVWLGALLSYVFDLIELNVSAFQLPFSRGRLKWYKTPREGIK